MRVLHLYAGNLYGGIERLLITLARTRELCPAMTHEFGLCFDGKLARELREAGAPVHILGNVRFSRPWTVRNARFALRSLLTRGSYDLAITHACWPQPLMGRVIRRADAPSLFWAHDAPKGTHWLERWAKRIP